MTINEFVNLAMKNTTIDQKTGCWLWNLYKDYKGYGRIKIDGKTTRIHRASAIIHKIIDSNDKIHLACHKQMCPNRNCWNPNHLYAGTHEDNMRDRDELGHGKSSKTRARLCKNGHDLDKVGFYISGRNRCCKICKKEYDKRKH